MIYHIVSESDFRAQLVGSAYTSPVMHTDGFVHCSLEASGDPRRQRLLRCRRQPGPAGDRPHRLTSETRYEEAAPIAGGARVAPDEQSPIPALLRGPIDTAAITRIGLLGKTTSGYAGPCSRRSTRSWPPPPGSAQDMEPESTSAALLIPRPTADTDANLATIERRWPLMPCPRGPPPASARGCVDRPDQQR